MSASGPGQPQSQPQIPALPSAPWEGQMMRRVFGEAYQADGATIIPVARVAGGGGGGSGVGENGTGGTGGGFGGAAMPLGVYIVRNGEVTWEPAVAALDLNRIIFVGQIIGALTVLTIGSILRAQQKERERGRLAPPALPAIGRGWRGRRRPPFLAFVPPMVAFMTMRAMARRRAK